MPIQGACSLRRTHFAVAVCAAVLTVTLLGALPAGARATTVTVRVEGANSTLVPLTQVTAPSAPVSGDGGAHSCPGNTVAGALDAATAHSWSGTWFSFGDYLVATILGETHDSNASDSDGTYWATWTNHASNNGVCSTPLNEGDDELFFVDCFRSPCGVGQSPAAILGLGAPATAQQGSPFSVSVTAYPYGGGSPSGASGATVTVRPGGQTFATDSSGNANVTLGSTGSFTLQATKSGDLRSETRGVCVHNGNDGNCGTSSATSGGSTGSAGTTAGSTSGSTPGGPTAGGAASPLLRTPLAHITGAREGGPFRRPRGPRVLTGTVIPDSSGLREVRLGLERRHNRRCQGYDGRRERLRPIRCGALHAPWWGIGAQRRFSYLLPFALPSGRYVLDVEAISADGRRDDVLQRGRNRIVFWVG